MGHPVRDGEGVEVAGYGGGGMGKWVGVRLEGRECWFAEMGES